MVLGRSLSQYFILTMKGYHVDIQIWFSWAWEPMRGLLSVLDQLGTHLGWVKILNKFSISLSFYTTWLHYTLTWWTLRYWSHWRVILLNLISICPGVAQAPDTPGCIIINLQWGVHNDSQGLARTGPHQSPAHCSCLLYTQRSVSYIQIKIPRWCGKINV